MAEIRYLSILTVLAVLPLCAKEYRYIKVEPKAMTVASAKKALINPKHDDYISAICSILESDLKEKEKTEILFKFFSDFTNLERLDAQHSRRSRTVRTFWTCATRLKDPNPLFLKLYTHKAFNADTDESRRRQGSLMSAITLIKEPSPELVKRVGDVKDAERMGTYLFEIVGKHGDDTTLKRVLDFARKCGVDVQTGSALLGLGECRHRPLVFTFLVDTYLKFGYRKQHLALIMMPEAFRFQTLSDYSRVRIEDAPTFIKQIDRVLAIKSKLQKLKSRSDRLTEDDLKDIMAVRKRMVVYRDMAKIKDAKDLDHARFRDYAAYGKRQELQRVLDLSRKLKESVQELDIPLAVGKYRHRYPVFAYLIGNVFKFKSYRSLKLTLENFYDYGGKKYRLGRYEDIPLRDTPACLKLFLKMYEDRSELRRIGMKGSLSEALNEHIALMTKMAKSYEKSQPRKK